MRGHLLAIEGPDGCGKSTQVALLRGRLEESGVSCSVVGFPRYEAPVYGELIAEFLRGEFGPVQAVPTKLVALLYALDRREARGHLRQELQDREIVITDRYVLSNMAFQGCKAKDVEEREALQRWIADVEFGYHQLPTPSANIVLHATDALLAARLSENAREGRAYLGGAADIHEGSLELQRKVNLEYQRLAQERHDVGPSLLVPVADRQGHPLGPSQIHQAILRELRGFFAWFRW